MVAIEIVDIDERTDPSSAILILLQWEVLMDVPAPPKHQKMYVIEMMARLGIEPGGGAVPRLGLSYATAFHRCEACPSKQACREWLDRMPRSLACTPHFCPDADIIFELQVDQVICNRTQTSMAAGGFHDLRR